MIFASFVAFYLTCSWSIVLRQSLSIQIQWLQPKRLINYNFPSPLNNQSLVNANILGITTSRINLLRLLNSSSSWCQCESVWNVFKSKVAQCKLFRLIIPTKTAVKKKYTCKRDLNTIINISTQQTSLKLDSVTSSKFNMFQNWSCCIKISHFKMFSTIAATYEKKTRLLITQLTLPLEQ